MRAVSVRRNVLANFVSQGWTTLMGLAFVPLYIRYLGVEAYGLLGVFALIQSLLPLLDLGMSPALSREMARLRAGAISIGAARDLLRTVEFVFTGIAAVVATSLWAGSNWLAASWLHVGSLPTGTVATAVAMMGAVVGLRFFEIAYRSSLIGLQRQTLLGGISASLATVRGVGALAALAWISPTATSFFVWQAVVSLLSAAVLGRAVYSTLPPANRRAQFSRSAVTNVRAFAGGMAGISILSLLLMQTDKLLLSRILPLDQYGYYMLAASIASLLYTVVAPIAQAFYPRFVELIALGDHAGLTSSYHKASQLVTVLAGSLGCLLVGFAEPALLLWSGDASLAHMVGPLLAVQALGILFNCLMWMPFQLQLAHGIVGLALKTNLLAIAVVVPLIPWIAPRYGPLGAAWIWVGLNAAYLLVTANLMYRRILPRERWVWYVEDLAAPLVTSIAIAMLFRKAIERIDHPVLEMIVLVLALACMLTASAMAASSVREWLFGRMRRLAPHFP